MKWGDRTLNIAHRGASLVAPPNTLAAFWAAVELGADGIECDVHLSADGIPVVIHDFTVDATTDGHGRVSEMRVAELKRLDAGASFSPRFAGERIPTLEEVLEMAGDRLLLNIELKTTSLADNGLERAVVSLLEGYGPARAGRVLLSSFNPFSLRRVKRLASHLPVGLLYAPDLPLPLRRAWLASLVPHEARHPHHSMVDASYISRARRRGYWVHTWTVDDEGEMRRLLTLGVEAIITDAPALLRALLSGRHNGQAAP
jgi:glycerophosphoryl diester phosphodiesterase